MTQPYRTPLALAILAAFALSAHAADGPTVTISGFGTAALTWTDTDQAEYIRPNQAAGVGKDPRPGVDSIFGIQGTAKFNDSLSVTVQGLSRKFATDQWGAELPWAFVKFKANDDFNIRVGRIGLPVYMVSDFRQVGYANTMIRPAPEVYRQVNADSFEGADTVYNHSFDDTTVTAQVAVGRVTSKNVGNFQVKFHPVTGLHVVVENGPFSVRFGRLDATFDIVDSASFTGLVNTLNALHLTQAASDYKIADIKGSFTSIGGTLDYHNFIVQAEYAVRKTKTRIVMDTSSYYAMLGYRYGKFTPYYYYGNIKQDNDRNYTGVPAVGPLIPLAASLNALGKSALQSTNAVGLRWDFYKSAALKMQIDRVKPRDGVGAFINAKPGFTGPVTVYAAGIDFVF